MNFLRQLIQKPLSSPPLAAISAIPAIRGQERDLKIAKIAGIAASNPRLTQNQKASLLSWLADIGETNAEAITRVIRQCQEDINIRQYFLGVALIHKKANTNIEDDCSMSDRLLRCEGYQPKVDNPDQRQPHERWPKLFNRNDRRKS